MKSVQALTLTPMDKAYSRVRDTVHRTLRERSIEPISYDQVINSSAAWANTVTETIQDVDLIVADVSRQSRHMFYELGFAHGIRKPTLVLLSTDAEVQLPYDLLSHQMLTYDPKDLEAARIGE